MLKLVPCETKAHSTLISLEQQCSIKVFTNLNKKEERTGIHLLEISENNNNYNSITFAWIVKKEY